MLFEIAVSTMNRHLRKNPDLFQPAVPGFLVVNQMTQDDAALSLDDLPHHAQSKTQIHNYSETGLSRSRNRAIEQVQADWVIFADDDLRYPDQINTRLEDQLNPNIDLLFFGNTDASGPHYRPGQKDFSTVFSSTSWTFAVRMAFVRKHNLSFDEQFGLGARYISTEENSFVFDCIQKGARIGHTTDNLVTHEGVSTGYIWTQRLWASKGAFFRRNYGLKGLVLGTAFVLKKILKSKVNPKTAVVGFYKGYTEYDSKT